MPAKRKDHALTAAQRMDAREALTILEGTELSLSAAARLATGKVSTLRPRTIQEAIDGLLKASIKKGLRSGTIEYYELTLGKFARAFDGDRLLDDVTRPQLRDWLEALPGSAQTAASALRCVRRLYTFALQQEPAWAALDPTKALKLDAPRRDRDIKFLTPLETFEIMEAARATHYAAALALMLFAGIRSEEIAGKGKQHLTWENIDFEAGIIRIPAAAAKTRTARTIENAPVNLWKWLEYCRHEGGPILPCRSRQAIQFAGDQIKRPWPKNAPRHSFATYHVALKSDLSLTALILGHEGGLSILHRHYRGLATRQAAIDYFGVYPEAPDILD